MAIPITQYVSDLYSQKFSYRNEKVITVYINNIESKPFWASLFDKFAGEGIAFRILPIKARKKPNDYEIPQDLIDQANYNLIFALDGSYLIRRFSSIGRRYSLEREHASEEALEQKLAKIITEFKEKINQVTKQDKSLPTPELLQVYADIFRDKVKLVMKQTTRINVGYEITPTYTFIYLSFLPKTQEEDTEIYHQHIDLQTLMTENEVSEIEFLEEMQKQKVMLFFEDLNLVLIDRSWAYKWSEKNAQQDAKCLIDLMFQQMLTKTA